MGEANASVPRDWSGFGYPERLDEFVGDVRGCLNQSGASVGKIVDQRNGLGVCVGARVGTQRHSASAVLVRLIDPEGQQRCHLRAGRAVRVRVRGFDQCCLDQDGAGDASAIPGMGAQEVQHRKQLVDDRVQVGEVELLEVHRCRTGVDAG